MTFKEPLAAEIKKASPAEKFKAREDFLKKRSAVVEELRHKHGDRIKIAGNGHYTLGGTSTPTQFDDTGRKKQNDPFNAVRLGNL